MFQCVPRCGCRRPPQCISRPVLPARQWYRSWKGCRPLRRPDRRRADFWHPLQGTPAPVHRDPHHRRSCGCSRPASGAPPCRPAGQWLEIIAFKSPSETNPLRLAFARQLSRRESFLHFTVHSLEAPPSGELATPQALTERVIAPQTPSRSVVRYPRSFPGGTGCHTPCPPAPRR